jgi:hypothetical protein
VSLCVSHSPEVRPCATSPGCCFFLALHCPPWLASNACNGSALSASCPSCMPAQVVSCMERVQQQLVSAEPRLQPCLLEPVTAHMTLLVLHITTLVCNCLRVWQQT